MRTTLYSCARSCRAASLLLVLLTSTLAGWAQAPAWQTAVALGSGSASDPNRYKVLATAGDGSGNLYVVGQFLGTVAFGATTLTSVNNIAGAGDLFLAKWSGSANAFLYARRIGQASATAASGGANINVSIAVSGQNVYVAGNFYGTIVFGSATGTVTLTSSGNSSAAYVARLTDTNTAGSFTWARVVANTTGAGAASVEALAATGSNVYFTGGFTGTASFGTIALTSAPATAGDVYVAKLSDTGAGGSFAWVQRAGGSGDDYPTAIAVNQTNVYVAGVFYSATATFGTATLTNAGGNDRDVFVAQLTDAGPTGSFGNAQRAGGVGRDRTFANGLVATANAVYLSGDFSTGVPLTFGGIALPATANGSVLARWNPVSGAFDWAQPAPGGSGSAANSLYFGQLASSGSSLYIAGYFSGTVALGGGTTLASSSPVAGDPNLWVGKFTDTGTGVVAAWAKQAGGDYPEYTNSLSLSGTAVYVQGSTGSATLAFSPLTLANPYYNGQYGSGSFLASLTDATLTATHPALAEAPLRLFPNPAHGTATARWAGGGPATLTLTDALGREARRYPVPAGPAETTLDLCGLPAGLYLLRGAAGRQRLVVE